MYNRWNIWFTIFSCHLLHILEWAPQLSKIQRPPSPLLLPGQVPKFKCTLVSTVTRLAGHAHRLQMSLVLLNFFVFFLSCWCWCNLFKVWPYMRGDDWVSRRWMRHWSVEEPCIGGRPMRLGFTNVFCCMTIFCVLIWSSSTTTRWCSRAPTTAES